MGKNEKGLGCRLFCAVIGSLLLLSQWNSLFFSSEHALPSHHHLLHPEQEADQMLHGLLLLNNNNNNHDLSLCGQTIHLPTSPLAMSIDKYCEVRRSSHRSVVILSPDHLRQHSLLLTNASPSSANGLNERSKRKWIVFDEVKGLPSVITLKNLYYSMDIILAYIQTLRERYPPSTNILIWIGATKYIKSIQNVQTQAIVVEEVGEILLYLLVKYAMLRLSVLCPVGWEHSLLDHEDTSLMNDKDLFVVLAKVASRWDSYHLPLPPSRPNNLPNLQQLCRAALSSRRYVEGCMPRPHLLYPILITGLGGSGSHFVADLLQKMQFRLYHEALGPEGSVSWLYAANDVYFNTNYPYGSLNGFQRSLLSPRFQHVIYLHRQPLKIISSLTSHTNKTYAYMQSVMRQWLNETEDWPSLHNLDQVYKERVDCWRGQPCNLRYAATVYLHWRAFANQTVDAEYSVEQVASLVRHVCLFLHSIKHTGKEKGPSSYSEACHALWSSKGQSLASRSDNISVATTSIKAELRRRKHMNRRSHGDYNLNDIAKRDEILAIKIQDLL